MMPETQVIETQESAEAAIKPSKDIIPEMKVAEESIVEKAPRPKKIMTLGDFMTMSASPETKPTARKRVVTMDEFMGVKKEAPAPAVKDEHRKGFIADQAMNFYAGIYDSVSSVNKILSWGLSYTPLDQVTGKRISRYVEGLGVSAGQEALKLRQVTYADTAGARFANDLSYSLGNMSATIPFDIMTGGATKASLVGKIAPQAEAILMRIPNFALGSAWRGLFSGMDEGKTVTEKVIKGVTGAAENLALNTLFASAGRGFSGVVKMAALSGAETAYQAAKQGRLPTGEEISKSMAHGAALAIILNAVPSIAESTTDQKEKIIIRRYEKEIAKHVESQDIGKVKETVDTMLADERIKPSTIEQAKIKLGGNVTKTDAVIEPIKKPETKISALAKGVEEKAIENKLTRGFKELPEYQVVDMKEQSKKAMALIEKDYELAKRISMGDEKSPEGILPESVFVAVENRAIKEGDAQVLKDLATRSKLTTEATTMGQRIRTLAERDPESPTGAIKDVMAAREAALLRKTKEKTVSDVKRKEVKRATDEIRKQTSKRETWESFIESIKCV